MISAEPWDGLDSTVFGPPAHAALPHPHRHGPGEAPPQSRWHTHAHAHDHEDGQPGDSTWRHAHAHEHPLPGVSVITPTWNRYDLLMARCIPSVQAQDYPAAEHVIISDGPDPKLREALAAALSGFRVPVRYLELPEHDPEPHYGVAARLAGIGRSAGEYTAYCDDDDALRPEHCRLMAAALDADPGAGFAVSRMISHNTDGSCYAIGWGALACGNVGTPMLCHRRETLEHGTWGPSGTFEDWELVVRWLTAGVRYVNVDADTCDVYPSVYR